MDVGRGCPTVWRRSVLFDHVAARLEAQCDVNSPRLAGRSGTCQSLLSPSCVSRLPMARREKPLADLHRTRRGVEAL
jgi:hypothetical protein